MSGTRAIEAIPDDEQLYRTVRAEHILGDILIEDAVEMHLPACSVDRARFRTAAESLAAPEARARGDSRVAVVTVAQLPPPVGFTDNGNTRLWEFVAEDAPLVTNLAHAEVRTYRLGERDRPHKPDSRVRRAELNRQLARRFRVLPADRL